MSDTCACVTILGQCPDPARDDVVMGCVHEHFREGPLCAYHSDASRDGAAECLECYEAGHSCPLDLIQAVPIGVPS